MENLYITGNLYITVEEFMKQIGNSHVDVELSVYGGAAMQISNAGVSYDDEEEELTFYYGLVKDVYSLENRKLLLPLLEKVMLMT